MACQDKIGVILRGSISTEEYSRYILVRLYCLKQSVMKLNILQGIRRSKLSTQTVLPEDAKSKCVLLNEKLQEFVIKYQMACSESLNSGITHDSTNEIVYYF